MILFNFVWDKSKCHPKRLNTHFNKYKPIFQSPFPVETQNHSWSLRVCEEFNISNLICSVLEIHTVCPYRV